MSLRDRIAEAIAQSGYPDGDQYGLMTAYLEADQAKVLAGAVMEVVGPLIDVAEGIATRTNRAGDFSLWESTKAALLNVPRDPGDGSPLLRGSDGIWTHE